jgi:hypothetical protein
MVSKSSSYSGSGHFGTYSSGRQRSTPVNVPTPKANRVAIFSAVQHTNDAVPGLGHHVGNAVHILRTLAATFLTPGFGPDGRTLLLI